MYRRYLFILSLFVLLCIPPLTMSYLYFLKAGELRDIEEMALQQVRSSDFCMVGTTLHEDLYHYKLALYRAYKPDVITLGSSRMGQYRKRDFSGRFLNMGSSMRSIAEGEHILKDMISVHKPKLILLGVDYWWFNDRVEKPGRTAPPQRTKLHLNIPALLQPYTWMYEGKIKPSAFLTSMKFPSRPSGRCRMGVNAKEEDGGFGPDGSYYYTGRMTGTKSEIYDIRFETTLKLAHKDKSKLRHAQRAHPVHISMFLDLMRVINDAGIKLIVILPPHAPRIVSEMSRMGDAYAYINDVRHQLTEAGISYYDFHNPAILDTTDCEFFDGWHPGEILNARILKALAQAGENELAAYLDMNAIESAISHYSGYVAAPDSRVTKLPEVDFLDIGCRKGIPSLKIP